MKTYKVIHPFRDLKDVNERVYYEGDTYEGNKTKARIAELSSDKNKIGQPLIVEEEETETEVEEKEE